MHRERERRRASKQPRAQAPVVIFLLVSPTSCWRRDTIITVLFSLSLFLYIQGNDGWSHCVERSKERERGRARGRTHSPFFRIERFTRGRERERARARLLERERTSKRIIMRRRMFNRGQNERDREREKSLLASFLNWFGYLHRCTERERENEKGKNLETITELRF